MSQHAGASLRLVPPDNISVRQVRLWLFARLEGSGAPAFVYVRGIQAEGSYLQSELFGPPGGNTMSSPFVSPVYPEGTSEFRTVLFCSAGAPGDCSLMDRRPLEIRGAETTLSESIAPRGVVDGGTLTTPGAQSGARSVTYTAEDDHSGVGLTEVALGDQVVASRNFGGDPGRCPHTGWAVCQRRVSEDLAIDTRSVPDGDYPLTVRVTDAASNRTVVQGGMVRVRNQSLGPGPVPNEPGGQPAVRFTNSKSSVLSTYRRVGYGKRLRVRGVLRDPAGRPLPNARVDVLLRPQVGETDLRLVKQLTTDGEGGFRYTVPRGPSRLVRFAYRPATSDSASSSTHDIRVAVAAGPTLRLSRARLRNGQSVRFTGQIRGVQMRKVVEIQVAERGTWKTIASVRSNSRGYFSWRYRFRRTFSPTKYTFRARVRTERSFPYATGSSPKRSVRVG